MNRVHDNTNGTVWAGLNAVQTACYLLALSSAAVTALIVVAPSAVVVCASLFFLSAVAFGAGALVRATAARKRVTGRGTTFKGTEQPE